MNTPPFTMNLRARLSASWALFVLASGCAPTSVGVAPAAPTTANATASVTSMPAVAAASPATSAGPETKKTDADRIDEIMAPLRDKPGCAVGVYRAGEVLFARGYGLANLEFGAPIHPDTRFDIGSISKQFTAAAVLLLEEDGKLSLDDDIRKYLPEMPKYDRTITIRHLLNHTSGIRDYLNILALNFVSMTDAVNEDDVYRLVTHQRALNFTPGDRYTYSNSGYFLLSLVVKRVAGKTLAQFSEERIFRPLGMNDTFILDDPRRVAPRRATSYDVVDDANFQTDFSGFAVTGDGSVQTTVLDLARWDANFYAPKVGGEALLRGLRTQGKTNDGRTIAYAGGLYIDTTSPRKHELHDGSWEGFESTLQRYPDDRLSVAVLCNQSDAGPRELEAAIEKVYLPPTPDPKGGATAPSAAPSTVDAAAFAPFAGRYVNLDTFDVRTLWIGPGTPQISYGDDAKRWDLSGLGPKKLRLKEGDLSYEILDDTNSKRVRLAERGLDEGDQILTRAAAYSPKSGDLEAYVGRYASEELFTDLEVAVKDGALYAGAWRRNLRTKLTPVIKDGFANGPLTYRFERDGAGHVNGIVVGTPHGARGVRGTRVRGVPSATSSR